MITQKKIDKMLNKAYTEAIRENKEYVTISLPGIAKAQYEIQHLDDEFKIRLSKQYEKTLQKLVIILRESNLDKQDLAFLLIDNKEIVRAAALILTKEQSSV